LALNVHRLGPQPGSIGPQFGSGLVSRPKKEKDYCLIISYEHELKHHETALIDGYRDQTWSAGWPHVPAGQRAEFSKRIGTITWAEIAKHWSIPADNELADLL
jgi:hypothetical protein